jgi:hypothetical protein
VLNTEAYRVLMHQPGTGETFRWFKGWPTTGWAPAQGVLDDRTDTDSDHGYVYEDKGTFTGLVSEQKRDRIHSEFGIIAAGTLWLTTMQDEVEFGQRDFIVLLERNQIYQDRLKHGTADVLHFGLVAGGSYVQSVGRVQDNAKIYSNGQDWRYDAETNSITWIEGGSAPASGAIFIAQYHVSPVYLYFGESVRSPRPVGGGQTPQKGFLQLAPAPA